MPPAATTSWKGQFRVLARPRCIPISIVATTSCKMKIGGASDRGGEPRPDRGRVARDWRARAARPSTPMAASPRYGDRLCQECCATIRCSGTRRPARSARLTSSVTPSMLDDPGAMAEADAQRRRCREAVIRVMVMRSPIQQRARDWRTSRGCSRQNGVSHAWPSKPGPTRRSIRRRAPFIAYFPAAVGRGSQFDLFQARGLRDGLLSEAGKQDRLRGTTFSAAQSVLHACHAAAPGA